MPPAMGCRGSQPCFLTRFGFLLLPRTRRLLEAGFSLQTESSSVGSPQGMLLHKASPGASQLGGQGRGELA